MRRLTAIPQLLASLAWVLLVAGNALHSPLAHHHGGHACCSTAHGAGESLERECGHHHAQGSTAGHDHTHHHEAAGKEDEQPAPEPESGPSLTHECELCQFLAQGVTPLARLPLQDAGRLISESPSPVRQLFRAHAAVSPPVRGPPSAA